MARANSTKQDVVNWLFRDAQQWLWNTNLKKKDLEKGWRQALKDLGLSEHALKIQYFVNTIWRETVVERKHRSNEHTRTTQTNVSKPEQIVLEEWHPEDEQWPVDFFLPRKTGKPVDVIFSDDGGTMQATAYLVDGEPGAGKTTVLMDIQKCLQNNYPALKTTCVQSEMKKSDIGYDFSKKPWMKGLSFQILKKYGYENIENTLIKIFTSGYHFIFVDSFSDIVEKLSAYSDMGMKHAENFLLQLMDNACDGINNNGVYSTIIAINQITKSGTFVGSMKLKHMTTGMFHVRMDEDGNRFILFSKNRRGGGKINKKLYFSLDANNEVQYDYDKFKNAEKQAAIEKANDEEMKEKSKTFFELAAKPKTDPETVVTAATELAKRVREAGTVAANQPTTNGDNDSDNDDEDFEDEE